VNLIVSQFQQWYDAFEVTENDVLYIPPEERISIF
jgi:predicted metalloendopeptidase